MPLKAKASQQFMPIKQVRDGVVILKDGGIRAVVLANSINLSLKSADEQRATIFQFQNFLNTLDFPIQISVQSRRLDIKAYLALLEDRIKMQSEALLKLQTREYINFIKSFTESVSIMTKTFFVVVPYTHTNINAEGGIVSKFWKRNKEEAKAAREVDFEEQRSQLEERVSVIQQGLSRCGIQTAQLGTEEIIEVFYKVFNPGEVENKIEVNNQI